MVVAWAVLCDAVRCNLLFILPSSPLHMWFYYRHVGTSRCRRRGRQPSHLSIMDIITHSITQAGQSDRTDIVLLATDRDHNLVHVPLVVWSRSIPADAICKVSTKAIVPQPDCFPANNNAPRSQQVLHISRTQGQPVVRPGCIRNDLTRLTEALQAQGCSVLMIWGCRCDWSAGGLGFA